MAPKSKVSKDDWDYCAQCGVHVPVTAKHVVHHHGNDQQPVTSSPLPNDRASDSKSPGRQTPKKQTIRGFVRRGILHGIAIERRIKGRRSFKVKSP